MLRVDAVIFFVDSAASCCTVHTCVAKGVYMWRAAAGDAAPRFCWQGSQLEAVQVETGVECNGVFVELWHGSHRCVLYGDTHAHHACRVCGNNACRALFDTRFWQAFIAEGHACVGRRADFTPYKALPQCQMVVGWQLQSRSLEEEP